MKEELISLETAKLAKNKGFDECVVNHYEEAQMSIEMFMDDVKNSEIEHNEYSAPTQCLLQRWLREEHKLTYVDIFPQNNDKWGCDIQLNQLSIEVGEDFTTYELALEAGLKEALNLIK